MNLFKKYAVIISVLGVLPLTATVKWRTAVSLPDEALLKQNALAEEEIKRKEVLYTAEQLAKEAANSAIVEMKNVALKTQEMIRQTVDETKKISEQTLSEMKDLKDTIASVQKMACENKEKKENESVQPVVAASLSQQSEEGVAEVNSSEKTSLLESLDEKNESEPALKISEIRAAVEEEKQGNNPA